MVHPTSRLTPGSALGEAFILRVVEATRLLRRIRTRVVRPARPEEPDPVRDLSYYATPPWAVRALLERERFEGTILEPRVATKRMEDAATSK